MSTQRIKCGTSDSSRRPLGSDSNSSRSGGQQVDGHLHHLNASEFRVAKDHTMSAQDQTTAQSSIEQRPSDGSQPSQSADVPPGEDNSDELSLDLVFEILKNSRRREVINYLREHDDRDRIALGELAEHVAAIENDTTTDALTSSQRKRVYVGLYQCHLPKMDDMGVVDFNQDRGHVALAANVDLLTEYLDRPAEEDSVDWYRYYGVISVIGVGIAALSFWVGLSSGVVLGLLGLVVGTFAFCSACHWVTESRDED